MATAALISGRSDKLLARGNAKSAIRSPNPKIWPFGHFRLINRPLRPLSLDKAAIVALYGFDKAAIGLDKAAIALDKTAIGFQLAIGLAGRPRRCPRAAARGGTPPSPNWQLFIKRAFWGWPALIAANGFRKTAIGLNEIAIRSNPQ